MKIDVQQEQVFGNNKNASKSFSIANSAKAFKILSNNLYKNKIRAIVRELSCNCLDAHKLNGNTRPFDIQPPSWMEQSFVIRDYGPGLSDEDIMNMYTTYFASTKDQSNDMIGAFGLGSKSPFSYTDTFSVRSIFDGIATIYNASMINGEPSISKVSDKETSEPSGIQITVPVKQNDIDKWINEIIFVLYTFEKDSFNVIDKSINVKSIDSSVFTSEYYMLDISALNYNDPQRNGNRLNAVYGNILYPLGDCPGIQDVSGWLNQQNGRVFIKFDLGELDITPSREELSYDETTVKNIITRIEKVNSKLMQDDIDKILKATKTSYKDGRNALERYTSSMRRSLETQSELADLVKYINSTNIKVNSINNKKYKDVKCYYSDGKGGVASNDYGRSNISLNRFFNWAMCYTVFVDVDCNKTLPKLIKKSTNYAELFPTGPHMFVLLNSPDAVKFKEDIEAINSEMKVEVVKMSELHKIAKFEQKVDADEVRPKSPNGILMKLGKEGYYEATDLYLTAKEARAVKGPVLYKYGDSYCKVDMSKNTGPRFSSSEVIVKSNSDSWKINLWKDAPAEYTVLRPSVWNYINQTDTYNLNDKITDWVETELDKVDIKDFNVNLLTKIIDTMYLPDICKKMDDTYSKAYSTTYDDICKFAAENTYQINVWTSTKASNKFKELKDYSTKTQIGIRTKLSKEKPLLYKILTNGYAWTDPIYKEELELLTK